MEETQRNIKDIEHGDMGLDINEYKEWSLGFDHEGQDVFMKIREVVLEDCLVPNISSFRKKEAIFF